VGVNAVFGCNPPGGTGYNWDCTISATGKVSMTGTASSVFANTNYGFAVSLPVVNNVPVVTCTSCHNQHSELIYSGKMGGVTGYYQTAFFLRGYYNPTTGGNNAAQFCRQCHGGESNEMAGQLGVPTT
jgi:cytochrome c553